MRTFFYFFFGVVFVFVCEGLSCTQSSHNLLYSGGRPFLELDGFLLRLIDVVASEEGQQHRKYDEPVEPAEERGEGEHLEEHDEDIRLRVGQDEYRHPCRKDGVEHGRPCPLDRLNQPLFHRPFGLFEGVADVRTVVDRQAHCYQQEDRHHEVDLHPPEVRHAPHVKNRSSNGDDDRGHDGQGVDQQEHDRSHHRKGDRQVLHQFVADETESLPENEGVRKGPRVVVYHRTSKVVPNVLHSVVAILAGSRKLGSTNLRG
mmetsp:Transcript_13492/g.27334  ORF Transcript_13492/g.27334 Transcript_13492/m.27334 type:complete len:259 (-) Transcript_13492:300-1076(-)